MAEEQGPGWGGVPARLDCIWGGGGCHMVARVGVGGERVEVRMLGGWCQCGQSVDARCGCGCECDVTRSLLWCAAMACGEAAVGAMMTQTDLSWHCCERMHGHVIAECAAERTRHVAASPSGRSYGHRATRRATAPSRSLAAAFGPVPLAACCRPERGV